MLMYEIIEGTDCKGSRTMQRTRMSGKYFLIVFNRMVNAGFFDRNTSLWLLLRVKLAALLACRFIALLPLVAVAL